MPELIIVASVAAIAFAIVLLTHGRRRLAIDVVPLEAALPPPRAHAALHRDPHLARARDVQRRMSPSGVVRVPGFAITGFDQMAGPCGGDWWSWHALPDGRLLIAVGDVTGHGYDAALVAVLA